jgi:outer membrane receptor protein involved in Fe transport
MKKSAMLAGLLGSALILVSGALEAGTTGKIAGAVRDQATKKPLVGANVTVVGTDRGAVTGLDGGYAILNLPPGVYGLRVGMLGYKSLLVRNVRVSVDLTAQINADLEPTVLETGESVTVVAERPLIRPDMTSSLATVGTDEIEALPINDVGDVLELQAGIVRSGGDLHIRGGRAGEVAYWVDGVANTDAFNGRMGLTVENVAIQELQVISGTYNAEFGQAMSGIINIITKEGTDRTMAHVRAYAGDYVSGDDRFSLLSRVNTMTDPATGTLKALGTKENPLNRLNPAFNSEFLLSGPVPWAGGKVTFLVSGRYINEEGYLYGRRWFTPQGNPGDSVLVPMDPYRRFSGQAKLTWRAGTKVKLSYSLFTSDWDKKRSFSRDWKYVPDSRPKSMGSSRTHLVALNHVLGPRTFYEVRINTLSTDYRSRLYDDPHATPNYLVRVRPDSALGIDARVFDPSTAEGTAELNQLRSGRIPFDYVIDPGGPAGYVHPDSLLSPASYSYNRVGTDLNYFRRSTGTWTGKIDLTSQVNPMHQIKAGGEIRFHTLHLNGFSLRPKTSTGGEEQIVPFEPEIPDVSTTYHNTYDRSPREVSAYLQDKIELEEINMNIGIRFDHFNANHVVPADPSDPNIYFPFKNVHRYRGWSDPPPNLSRDEYDAYVARFEEYTPAERRAFMHEKVEPHWAISPRLGIAYPITDRGVIHFSYGHFFQIPEFQYLYDNPDFKVNSTGGYFVFGNAALKPQRTVQYEIGLQQQITGSIGIDATVFYRDVRDWVGTSPLISTPIPSVKYSRYENKDYSNVRGLTLKVEKRRSRYLSARFEYTYSVAEGTYSNPVDAFNAAQAQEEPRLALIPLNWDRRHTLNGSLVFQRAGWTVSMIGRFWTGLPYTPSFPQGEFVGGSTLIGLRENSARNPSQKNVDLTVQRTWPVGSWEVSFFIYIYNVFDNRDEVSVYGDTGTADYTTYINPEKIGYNAGRIGTVEDYVLQPGWYTPPRQVQVGLSVGF